MPFRLSTLMATYALNWRFLRVDTADEVALGNSWRELLPKKLPTADQRTRKSVARPQRRPPQILRRHTTGLRVTIYGAPVSQRSGTDGGFGTHPSLGSSINSVVSGS